MREWSWHYRESGPVGLGDSEGACISHRHVCILAFQAMILFLEVVEYLEGTLRGGA